jgi:hypothetical protein
METGHAWDILQSVSSLANFMDNGSGASFSEVNAMYWENMMRSLHGMPLRIEYDPGVVGTPRANVQTKALLPYTFFLGKILYMRTTLKNLDGTQTYNFNQ